jgi:hypothetical protein
LLKDVRTTRDRPAFSLHHRMERGGLRRETKAATDRF